MTLRASTIGLIVGLILGYFLLTRGLDFTLPLAIFALIGWLVGKLISGEINIDAIRQLFTRR
jgi:hypothetical protein